jgi:hypothetical protein
VLNIELLVEKYTLREYSSFSLSGLYNALLVMVYHLDDASTHDSFASCCRLLRLMINEFPVASFILQGAKAIAWSLGVPIPPQAKPFFQNLAESKDSLRDVPLGLVLPKLADVQSASTDGDETSPRVTSDISTLLSKWSAISFVFWPGG